MRRKRLSCPGKGSGCRVRSFWGGIGGMFLLGRGFVRRVWLYCFQDNVLNWGNYIENNGINKLCLQEK